MPTIEQGVQIPGFDDQANGPDAFKQLVDGMRLGKLLGEAVGGTASTTLATASPTAFQSISGSGVQLPTLTVTRRVRIIVEALFTMGTGGTNGYYAIGVAYQQVGVSSAPTVIRTMPLIIPAPIGSVGQHAEATAVLTPGDWIAEAVAYRYSGGVATDRADEAYCAAYDVLSA